MIHRVISIEKKIGSKQDKNKKKSMRISQSKEFLHSFRNKVKNKKKSMRIPLSLNDPSRNFDPSLRLMTFGDRLPMTLILHHRRKNYGTKINYRRRFYHPIKVILTLR